MTELPKLNLAAALAVLSALDDHGIQARIKWPNDIMVGDEKLAGILVENSLEGEQSKFSVVGIGLNINQRQFKTRGATSMQNTSGNSADVLAVVQDVFNYLYNYVNLPLRYLVKQVDLHLFKKDEWVSFATEGKSSTFLVKGFHENGGLRVVDGETETVLQHHQYKWIR